MKADDTTSRMALALRLAAAMNDNDTDNVARVIVEIYGVENGWCEVAFALSLALSTAIREHDGDVSAWLDHYLATTLDAASGE